MKCKLQTANGQPVHVPFMVLVVLAAPPPPLHTNTPPPPSPPYTHTHMIAPFTLRPMRRTISARPATPSHRLALCSRLPCVVREGVSSNSNSNGSPVNAVLRLKEVDNLTVNTTVHSAYCCSKSKSSIHTWPWLSIGHLCCCMYTYVCPMALYVHTHTPCTCSWKRVGPTRPSLLLCRGCSHKLPRSWSWQCCIDTLGSPGGSHLG